MICTDTLTVGPLYTNCYVVYSDATREAVLIDPGADWDKIKHHLESKKLQLSLILLTHGHVDHVGASHVASAETKAPVFVHYAEREMMQNPFANLSGFLGDPLSIESFETFLDGAEFEIGDQTIRAVHTPGHTEGSSCFILNERIFCGDLIFNGGVGRTDLPGGSLEKLRTSIAKLMRSFGDHYHLLPGHGEPTTIGRERESNSFVRSFLG